MAHPFPSSPVVHTPRPLRVSNCCVSLVSSRSRLASFSLVLSNTFTLSLRLSFISAADKVKALASLQIHANHQHACIMVPCPQWHLPSHHVMLPIPMISLVTMLVTHVEKLLLSLSQLVLHHVELSLEALNLVCSVTVTACSVSCRRAEPHHTSTYCDDPALILLARHSILISCSSTQLR